MPDITRFTDKLAQRLTLGLLLGGLLLFAFLVLQPFIIPIAWACILAYVTWPLCLWLRRRCGKRTGLAALLATLLLAIIFILPLLWISVLVRSETALLYDRIMPLVQNQSLKLPELIKNIPWFGQWLQEQLSQIVQHPQQISSRLSAGIEQISHGIFSIIGGIGRNIAKMGFAFITLFFIYRDGEKLLLQTQTVLHRLLGNRVDHYLLAIGQTTRAVVWGLIITAFAQGVVAGLGYWWFDITSPVLMAVLTAILALIPLGAPVVWGTLCAWLILNDQWGYAIGLALWGFFVVGGIDNLIRPIVISTVTRISFLLILFGVLGGMAAFGLIGLFIGPVTLAIALAVWREWLHEQADTTTVITPPPDTITLDDTLP